MAQLWHRRDGAARPSAAKRIFRTLDDPATLEMAARDPEALFVQPGPLTIDEVQKNPAQSRVESWCFPCRWPSAFLEDVRAAEILAKRS